MNPLLLAELEIWHSRPLAPTRRLSLGNLMLPIEPLPGFGGLLIGAVVATFLPAFDDDQLPDLQRLVNQVERGDRVIQPRLRHRYQVDRHGLASTVHRLHAVGDNVAFDISDTTQPIQQVLGAIYATERFAPAPKRAIIEIINRAMRWSGPVGPSFVAFLAGVGGSTDRSAMAFADPKAWALDVLGFPLGTLKPTKREVLSLYRSRLIDVHPDHGGVVADAAKSISDLHEARRILTS